MQRRILHMTTMPGCTIHGTMMRTTDGYDPGTMVTKMMMMVNPETSGGYMVGTGATNEIFP
jgi:hypothetical protein